MLLTTDTQIYAAKIDSTSKINRWILHYGWRLQYPSMRNGQIQQAETQDITEHYTIIDQLDITGKIDERFYKLTSKICKY